MVKNIFSVAILLLMGSGFNLVAQEKRVLETNPPSVKWHQINTSYYQVIYPENYRDEANRVANVLAVIYEPVSLSLGAFPEKTRVVLQNRNTVSNAFVTWGPRRAEYFTMSPQDYNFLGVNDWMEMIAIHEQRHVVQQEKSLTGLNKVFYYLFGQSTTGGMSAMAVPYWFWEGDAVCMETAMTPSGRGRIPEFSMAMRANLLEKGAFNYNKQYLRSFKDFVPNHYVTGYYFSAWMREKYGPAKMAKMTRKAWSWPIIPYTFSNAIKSETGSFLVKNYDTFIADLEEVWSDQVETADAEVYTPINRINENAFTNYKYPHKRRDGKLLAVKAGIGDISAVVLLDEAGNEEKIAEPGLIRGTGMFSANDDYAVWVEHEPDPRWPARVYSVVKVLDLESGKIQKITRKSRYAVAAINHAGDEIVAVEEAETGDVSIVTMTLNGQITNRMEKGKGAYYHMPSWSFDDANIVMVKNEDHCKTIVTVDPNSGKEQVLMEANTENVGYPRKYGKWLFYNSPLTGIDNIIVKDLGNGKMYQFSNAEYGAFNPHYVPDEGKVYFNDYQVDGHNITSKDFEASELKEVKSTKVKTERYAELVTRQEGSSEVLDEVRDFDYPYEKYSKLKHLVNPHSWGVTLESLNSEFRFFVNSKDVLSTTTIGAGYIYNANEQTGAWEVNLSYQNFYPILDVAFRDGRRQIAEQFINPQFEDSTFYTAFEWEERGLDMGIRVPLNLTRNKYYQSMDFEVGGSFKAVRNYLYFHRPDDLVQSGYLSTADLNFSYERMLKTSKRDIKSRFGQKLSLTYRTTPFGGDYESSLFAAEGELYFPGLIKHHSLWFRGGYQYEDKVNYVFESPLTFPRGYRYTSFDNLFTASANYAFPVWYPDVALGPVLNFQRIRANLYYDYGYGYNYTYIPLFYGERYLHAAGVEVNFDINIMRFLPMLDIGFRYNYLPDDGASTFNILVGSIGI